MMEAPYCSFRKLERSYFSKAGCHRKEIHTVGGANMELIPSRSMSAQHSAGSGAATMWLTPPTSKSGMRKTCIWTEW